MSLRPHAWSVFISFFSFSGTGNIVRTHSRLASAPLGKFLAHTRNKFLHKLHHMKTEAKANKGEANTTEVHTYSSLSCSSILSRETSYTASQSVKELRLIVRLCPIPIQETNPGAHFFFFLILWILSNRCYFADHHDFSSQFQTFNTSLSWVCLGVKKNILI